MVVHIWSYTFMLMHMHNMHMHMLLLRFITFCVLSTPETANDFVLC